MPEAGIIWATGRRKSAVARVRMKPGSGQTIVNGRPMTEYFPREVLHMRIQNPFEVSATEGRWGHDSTGWKTYLGSLCAVEEQARLGGFPFRQAD